MLIDKLSSIYYYQTDRKAWKNNGINNSYVLSYQVSGHYDHKFGSDILEVKADTLFFIPKSTPYSVQCKSQGKSICVNFSGEIDLPPTVYDCSDRPEIKLEFLKLMNYKNLHSKVNYCEAAAIVYSLFSFLYKISESEYVAHDTRSKLEKARQFINEHYTDTSLKISDVAEKFGIGEKYFRVCFKKVYNVAPSQYIISLRLQSAEKFLTESDLNISEIAFLSGFCDVYYFSKMFKSRFSLSPKEYRRAQNEK